MTARRQRPHVIRDARAIRLLASPIRQAVVDWIAANGPATVAELSERFARPANRLYYHVRLLVRAGLLVSTAARRGGRPEARFDVVGRPLTLAYATAPSHRRAVTTVIEAMLRSAGRDFARAAADPSVRVEGSRRELWAGRVEGVLEPADVETVNRLLRELTEVLLRARARPSSRATPMQCSFVLSPAGTPHRRP